ncbi:CRISPR-associated endonuclease Cas1 [Patescibacteria group bacterium]|nr:CRISPR-associated endonuclease Cas1 [Patescibacteria group bacterium]
MKIILKDFGYFLGTNEDTFKIKQNDKLLKEIPFENVHEIVIGTRNAVSVDALAWASLYRIGVVITLHNGKPLAVLHSIKDMANVKTRLNQFRAYESRKGLEIAKKVLIQKLKNENNLLKHYNLKSYEQNRKLPSLEEIRNVHGEKITQALRLKLHVIEENFSKYYYAQMFPLLPKWLRILKRVGRNAVEPYNNLLNLSYEVLEWKILKSCLKSKLELYLGFLHSVQYGKPSLVLDLIEPFRPYIIHFLMHYSKTLTSKDFQKHYIIKDHYPRYFLKHKTAWNLIETINKQLFEAYLPMQRNRKHGKQMSFETFIDEYVSSIAGHLNANKPIKREFPSYSMFSFKNYELCL